MLLSGYNMPPGPYIERRDANAAILRKMPIRAACRRRRARRHTRPRPSVLSRRHTCAMAYRRIARLKAPRLAQKWLPHFYADTSIFGFFHDWRKQNIDATLSRSLRRYLRFIRWRSQLLPSSSAFPKRDKAYFHLSACANNLMVFFLLFATTPRC